MRNLQVLPSILAADHGRFVEEVSTVDIPQVQTLHIDIMDGNFVPNITFGPETVRSLRKHHPRFHLDVHLMIENVDVFIPAFADAGADTITIHQEVTRHLHINIQQIRALGKRAGVAINPGTPSGAAEAVLRDVDLVLVMTVNPGFGGQAFLPSTMEKVRTLAEIREIRELNYLIEVDGGIDRHTAAEAHASGADWLVAGSAVFNSDDRPAAIHKILDAARSRPSVGGLRIS